MTWSERIPAAIERAEGLVAATREEFAPCPDKMQPDWEKVADLGPDAVALAKELWVRYSDLGDFDLDYFLPKEAPSLIAFVEKVEAL